MRKQTERTLPEGKRYERPGDILRRVPVSRSWLYEQLAAGTIPSYRAGRSVLVPVGAVDEYLEREASGTKAALEAGERQRREPLGRRDRAGRRGGEG